MNPRVLEILTQIPKEKTTKLANKINGTIKKFLPILLPSTRRPNIQDLETTPYTTPSSVLRSYSTTLSIRLEPQWNFFRIGFK